MGGRLMVGLLPLEENIGVRLPAPQPRRAASQRCPHHSTPKLTESQGFGDDFIFPLGSTDTGTTPLVSRGNLTTGELLYFFRRRSNKTVFYIHLLTQC